MSVPEFLVGLNGFNPYHDLVFTIINKQGQLVYHCEIERIVRRKGKRNKYIQGRFSIFPKIRELVGENPIAICWIAAQSPKDRAIYELLGSNKQDYGTTTNVSNSHDLNIVELLVVGHHYAHIHAAIAYREYEDLNGFSFIAADGQGWSTEGRVIHNMFGTIDDGTLNIFKRNFARSGNDIGAFFGWNGTAGKLMGLAGYLQAEPCRMSENEADALYRKRREGVEYSDYDLLRMAQNYAAFIEDMKIEIGKLHQQFDLSKGVCVGGGVFLALELNTWIYQNITTKINFAPCTNDSGLSLGAVSFGYHHYYGHLMPPITTPFIVDNYRASPKAQDYSPRELAKRLAEGEVIGLIRGKSEAGPRALGHRSILADPRDPAMYEKVSRILKDREYYRPIAPVVTERMFDRLFDGPKGRYMQYRVFCTDECRECLPVITHRDGSARPQVVYQDDDPWLHTLLVEFGKLTGYECLVNTSLNRKRPICMTVQDALKDFEDFRDSITIIHSSS